MTSLPSQDQTSQRIGFLDALRGFSLLGIALVNAPELMHFQAAVPGSPGAPTYWLLQALVQERFFPIFSMLFGIGFALFMRNARSRGERPWVPMLRRLGALLVFGLLHRLLNPGEVLTFYAVFGLLLLPFERAPLPVVFGVAGLVALGSILTTSILLSLAMFIFGLGLFRAGVFEAKNQPRLRVWLRWNTPVLLLLGLALSYWYYQTRTVSSLVDLQTVSGLVLALAYSGALCLLLDRPGGHMPAAGRALALLGRMSLSNYILQTLLFVGLGRMLGLNTLGWQDILWVCLPVYAINFAFSALWLSHFDKGPMEWLWRCATEARWLPLKRVQARAA